MAEVADAAQPGLGADLSALALISLGSTEYWATASQDAGRCLDRGITLARQGGRPYLEFIGLAHQALHEFYHSFARAAERGRQAAELAERHGWTGDPAAGTACMAIAVVLVWQGQPDAAEPWVQRAGRTLTAGTQPVAVLAIRLIRGMLELERDRNAAALAALEAGEALARLLAGPNYFAARLRALLVYALIRLGQAERAGQFLAGLSEQDRERGELRVAAAALRLAQGDPQAALAALAPIQEHPVPEDYRGFWRARADARQGRARRPRCRRCRPRARTRPVRTQRRPDPVPAVSRCGPAGASCPAPHRPRRPCRRDPRPARRNPGGATARGATALPARAAAGTAQRQRDPRAALPAHQPDRTGSCSRRARQPPAGVSECHHASASACPARATRSEDQKTTVKFLIRDRVGQFSGSFDAVGIGILASLPQAPRSERDLREDHRDSAPGALGPACPSASAKSASSMSGQPGPSSRDVTSQAASCLGSGGAARQARAYRRSASAGHRR